MQKSSLKLYLVTFVITLALATFAFAGEGHCPDVPPPPDDPGGRMSVPAVKTSPSEESSSRILKTIWDFFAQSVDLF